MPRFIPPHLMALVALLMFVAWMMLARHFRRSAVMQRFVAEVLGDETPQSALKTFELAKQRLADHLSNAELDRETRLQIEVALGLTNTDQIHN